MTRAEEEDGLFRTTSPDKGKTLCSPSVGYYCYDYYCCYYYYYDDDDDYTILHRSIFASFMLQGHTLHLVITNSNLILAVRRQIKPDQLV